MAEKGGGRGAVFGMFVVQAIGATGSHSYVTPFPTTVTPICTPGFLCLERVASL